MSIIGNIIINFVGIMVRFDLRVSTKIVFAILLSNLMMFIQIGAFALIFFNLTKGPKTFIINYKRLDV